MALGSEEEKVMSANKDLLDALERAGIDMDELARLSPDNGLLVVERDDLDQKLVFREARDWPEGTKRIWRWNVWRPLGAVRWNKTASGQEPDLPSMVAKVVEFLSKEES